MDKMLTTKDANPDADIAAEEAKIDQLVYKLYDLTAEEIEVIETSLGTAQSATKPEG